MKFRIVAVGKIKESYLRDALSEYVKRIGRYATVEIVEIDECLSKGTQTEKEIQRVIKEEGVSILAKLEGYVVAMDIDGQQVSSEQLSEHIREQKQYNSTFTFVIGGSNGLSDEVKHRADMRCSFGKITLPHQLFRVVLAEQLYRACCIEYNIAYHK
ncbi:MAG: 23S rRNA (pseudouridine(1915)-N(3))-methyltransferase RlmH [Clostridiales bacterium]|nr:23S rRNA (pseudouridine(1915)-N(3))-methyltransferase RlmH [Clostridiales bacterium]